MRFQYSVLFLLAVGIALADEKSKQAPLDLFEDVGNSQRGLGMAGFQFGIRDAMDPIKREQDDIGQPAAPKLKSSEGSKPKSGSDGPSR